MSSGKSAPRNTMNPSPISRLRMAAGITQKQLAERIGVLPQQVGRWERGERRPKLDSIKRLACALGCSMDDLIE